MNLILSNFINLSKFIKTYKDIISYNEKSYRL